MFPIPSSGQGTTHFGKQLEKQYSKELKWMNAASLVSKQDLTHTYLAVHIYIQVAVVTNYELKVLPMPSSGKRTSNFGQPQEIVLNKIMIYCRDEEDLMLIALVFHQPPVLMAMARLIYISCTAVTCLEQALQYNKLQFD
jgi:hypothetical protein